MAKQSKSEAHKFGALLAKKQIKVKASMSHEAKMPKENEDKVVSSKAKEGKNVETLMKNMKEAPVKNMEEASMKNMNKALAKPTVCYKIIVGEANEPLLLDSIVGLIDDIFD
ncbi:hypothetical protein SLEP1_g12529 [Rubroshorea leprosula]|uniref:Uncharacterized protein n=1 Tax=Rubroshorea leprosula TaxID=152421 RepID=A0AAV5IIV1_9ROSI|nr:hypothetical protein SLEP1_g12529 [Rubroshorea leprosula]